MARKSELDLPTWILFAGYAGALGSAFVLHGLGWIPAWLAFLLGLAAYNLSFTIWHECAHGTVARRRGLCTAVGIATTLPMIYPGYFFQRREHLLHHKFQGDPDKDPVYPRTQCTPWMFPVQLVRVTLFPPQPPNGEPAPPAGEVWADRACQLLFVAGAVAAVLAGWGWTLLFAWVLPRAVILFVHAFYVCYLPHSVGGPGGYEKYRIVTRGPLLRLLTVSHNYHGLHHLWPTIPWHRYRATFQERRADLEARGVEILDRAGTDA